MIKKRIEKHSIDNYILLEPKKQQIFYIPKEESQMFSSKEKVFVPGTTYSNNINSESENRIGMLENGSMFNASWNATDYIGLATYEVPYNINPLFCDIRIISMENGLEFDFPTSNLFDVTKGVQKLKIPANYLDTAFMGEDSEEEGTDFKYQYGDYLITITPKSFEATIVDIEDRKHYPITEIEDGVGINRRTIYHLNADDFNGTPWNFTGWRKQSGRLLGSIVEIIDSVGNVKQTKIINENDFNNIMDVVKVVISPDNVGYDSPLQEISIGDKMRIYPRETYFNPINIDLTYVSETELAEQAYKYMMNDVVRDMTTGVYEIYDKNGFTINADGTFSGNVIQRYQIQQIGKYELRKKIIL